MVTFQEVRAFQESLSKYGFAGTDLSVYVGYQEVYRHMTGYADVENRKPIDRSTLYKMYSMTKPVTVAAAMQLFEQGKFLLDDPVSRFLPEFAEMTVEERDLCGTKKARRPAKNPILMHHLFEMTSGISYSFGTTESFLRMYERTNGAHTLRDVASAIAEAPLLFDPGTHWYYSMAHDVLARIVEVISGMKYGEYLRKNIFDPLGMEKACHHPSEEEMKNCAKTYKLGENGELVPGNKEHFFRTGSAFEGGGTGLTCSVDEYAKFTKALTHLGLGETGNRILSSRTVNLIRTNRLTGSLLDEFQRSTAARSEYGYGLGVRTMLDRTKKGALSPFGEFGWDGALSTHMSADPENKVSLVFGVQTNGSDKTPPFKMIFRNMIYAALEYEGYIGAER